MNEINITSENYTLSYTGPVTHISTDMTNYYTKDEVNSAITTANAEVIATVNQTLTNYVTSTALTTTLASYVTNTALATTLANYVTNTSLNTTLEDYQLKANLVTLISASSTDVEYPSAKCVYDVIGNINSVLDAINGEVV